MDQSLWLHGLFTGDDFANPSMLFIFGLFLVLGVLGAILAHAIKWLPTITAFMLLGAAFGPNGFGWIDETLLSQSKVLIDIALGLILYKLGSDVQLRHMLRSTKILRLSIIEVLLTYGVVFGLLLGGGLKPLVAGLIAAISVSSSPAVLVHMTDELQARGPVIYQAKALLALNNIFAFFLFSLLMPFALGAESFHIADMLLIPLYRAVGAIGIGAIIAFAMTQIDRFIDNNDAHFRFALIIGGIAMTLGLTSMFSVSSLLAALTLGIVTRWLETQRQGLTSIDFGASSDLFFIVLFVMAGASLHLNDLKNVGLLALFIALARGAAKVVALVVARRYVETSAKNAVACGLMLSPLGALAIGLVQTVQSFSPTLGSEALPIVFAMVALLETFGPFAVGAGIRVSGESPLYQRAVALATPAEEKTTSEGTLPLP